MAVRVRKNFGPSGLADVRILTKGVRVTMEDGTIYDLPLAGIDAGHKSGQYIVSLSKGKDKVYLHPVPGRYIMRFKQLGNRVGDIPTIKKQDGGWKESKSGGVFWADDQLVFTIVCELVGDTIYSGLTTQTQLPYSFTAAPQGPLCDIVDRPFNLKQLETVFQVMANTALGMVEIPYNPDPSAVLLSVEKYLRERSELFMGSVNEKGFLDLKSIAPIPADMLPKKLTKKTAKKK